MWVFVGSAALGILGFFGLGSCGSFVLWLWSVLALAHNIVGGCGYSRIYTIYTYIYIL